MPRFGVKQKGDIRAIDDGRSNGANAATSMVETVTTPHFIFSAVVARAAHVAASSLRQPMAPMQICLLDLASAYRAIPTSQPWLTSIIFYNPNRERSEMYYLPGHNFGLVSSVVNFNRYPELIVIMARAMFVVFADH